MQKHWIFVWGLWSLLGLAACGTQSPEYDLEVLQGKWQRLYSSDTRSDSMVLEVRGDSAVILYVPTGSNFNTGQVKWRGITSVVEPGNFTCADLSADGDRWQAAIFMIDDETGATPEACEVVNQNYPDAPGGVQGWERLP